MYLNQPAKFAAILVLLILTYTENARCQNLESIGKEKPLTVSGGVSLSQIFYTASGVESRRDPYTYFASGNVNFSLYGWSVPLSFSVSNQNTSFQQPFNQYSLHPTYKWVTGHFGYTSMSYSPYTVSGHIFLGGAIDAAPQGKFKFSALYGRFLKAVEADTLSENPLTPAFKRMGYGVKASYADGGDMVDLILFHAKDDTSSLSYVPENDGILPEENLVVSIAAGKTVLQHFLLKAELAASALTRDIRAPEADHTHALAKTGFLYDSRTSSSYYKAFKTSFSYQGSGYTLGVGYERIDPQYRTLGAYYFNNDLENITVNGATAILQGKLNLAANAGTQRDNLDNTKVSTMRRMVGSFNVGYAPSQKVNLSASYSTFQTYTNIRSQFIDINQLTPYDNLDTLNFTQISKNATLSAMYMFGADEKKRQSLNLNLTVQDAADRQGEVEQNSGARFYNANTAYSLNVVPKSMTVSVSFNATLNEITGGNSRTYGPTVAISRSFLDKKLRTTLSSSYNNSYGNSQLLSTIMNVRLNGSITLRKKHNINLSTVMVDRESRAEGTAARSFTEFTGTLGYSYNFGTQ